MGQGAESSSVGYNGCLRGRGGGWGKNLAQWLSEGWGWGRGQNLAQLVFWLFLMGVCFAVPTSTILVCAVLSANRNLIHQRSEM